MSSPLTHVEALEKVEDLEGVLGAIAAITLQKPETEHSCRRALRQIGALIRETFRTRPPGRLVPLPIANYSGRRLGHPIKDVHCTRRLVGAVSVDTH